MTRPVLANLDSRGVAALPSTGPRSTMPTTATMIQGLLTAMDELAGKPGLRVVLLKGNGKHFQAGADLKWIRRGARRLGRGERARQPRHGRGRRPAQPSAGADRGAGAGRLLRRRHRHHRRLRRGDRRRQRHLLHRRGALGPHGRHHHSPAQRRHLGAPAAPLRADRRALRRRRGTPHRARPPGGCRSTVSQPPARRWSPGCWRTGRTPSPRPRPGSSRAPGAGSTARPSTRSATSHAAKRRSPEAGEGLASFAEKRAANWQRRP